MPSTKGSALAHGPRMDTYGDPAVNFARIGRLWGAILCREDISPEVVGLMLIAVKISREVAGHSDDSLDDIEGYVECIRLVVADA